LGKGLEIFLISFPLYFHFHLEAFPLNLSDSLSVSFPISYKYPGLLHEDNNTVKQCTKGERLHTEPKNWEEV